jgi:hypothetical protein
MDGARAMPGCLVGNMEITEVSRDMMGYPVCYTEVMEGSRAMLGCLVREYGYHRGVLGKSVVLSVHHSGHGEVQGHAGVLGGVH